MLSSHDSLTVRHILLEFSAMCKHFVSPISDNLCKADSITVHGHRCQTVGSCYILLLFLSKKGGK